MADETYLTPGDIRARLGVSLTTAYNVVRQCEHIKFGRSVRVAETAFQRWLAEHTKTPAPRAPVRPDERRHGEAVPSWLRIKAKVSPKIGVPRQKPVEYAPDRPRIKLTRPRE